MYLVYNIYNWLDHIVRELLNHTRLHRLFLGNTLVWPLMLGLHGHAHACVHMGMSHFIPHHVQKVARLSAVQGRTMDIAGHDSLACWYTFVAHLKPEHLMVHPKLVLGNHCKTRGCWGICACISCLFYPGVLVVLL